MRVLQSYSTEKAQQNQLVDFNSIKRYSLPISQRVRFIRKKYSFAIYLYNGTLGTFLAHHVPWSFKLSKQSTWLVKKNEYANSTDALQKCSNVFGA